MTKWQKSLSNSIISPEQLSASFGIDYEPLTPVTMRYPMRITPHYLSLISEPDDAIWRQSVPDPLELSDLQNADPLDEERLSPVPGLIHRYPDRVVWLVSNECAVYCRFCMRKRKVGVSNCTTPSNIDAVIEYIASNSSIHDVILSGGDPLILQDDQLFSILSLLRKIPHVAIIRIGSRVPVTLPDRITPALCLMLKMFHPIYINTHFNHPREITPESINACSKLADSGIPIGNQTVLLKGVNDSPGVMKELMTSLIKIRVKPYYIHHMDLVKGTRHFRTTTECGLRILEQIRGHASGIATPHYMVDLPGGKGKVPLLPTYSFTINNVLKLKNYLGEVVDYPEDDVST